MYVEVRRCSLTALLGTFLINIKQMHNLFTVHSNFGGSDLKLLAIIAALLFIAEIFPVDAQTSSTGTNVLAISSPESLFKIRDPIFWTIDIQRGVYKHYLEKRDFSTISKFYDLILEINNGAVVLHNYTEISNPLFIIIDTFDYEGFTALYTLNKEMFLRGEIQNLNHGIAPIVYAVQRPWEDIRFIRFFFDHNIRLDQMKDPFGEHYGFNMTNLLTYSKTKEMTDYLVAAGIPQYINLSNTPLEIKRQTNLFDKPSIEAEVISSIKNGDKYLIDKITYEKHSGLQWYHVVGVKGLSGWVPITDAVSFSSEE